MRHYAKRGTPARKKPVCVFHNDGERLHAFPATWQAAHDFLAASDRSGYALPVSASHEIGMSANDTEWGKLFGTRVDFLYTGNAGRVAYVSLGNNVWGLNNLRIPAGRSLLIAYVGGKGLPCRW